MLERLCSLYSFGEGTEEIWRRALEDGRVRPESYEGLSFFRLNKDVKGLKRGTILTDDGIIMAYPRIPRILHLSRGIRKNLHSPFYMEEKVDGYNIRIALVGGRIIALTRGGFICPFTTDRLEDFMDLRPFFRVHPHLVVCCEVAGPEGPYNPETPPHVDEDVRFFVFDIMEKGTGRFMPPEEKYSFLEEWGLPGVRVLGRFLPDEGDGVREVLLSLNREGCEGVVIKPVGEGKVIKYVTPSSHIRDIRVGSLMIEDLPPGYFLKRLIMLTISIEELGLDGAGIFEDLGRAFLEPLSQAMERVEAGEGIKETFSIRVRKREAMERLMEHLKGVCQVEIEPVRKRKEGEYWRMVFTRRYRKTERILRTGLRGSLFMD